MDEKHLQDVRARLYIDLARVLLDSELVAHVDRYNNQFAHLDEEKVLRYPCALIEFPDIEWEQIGRLIRIAKRAKKETNSVAR